MLLLLLKTQAEFPLLIGTNFGGFTVGIASDSEGGTGHSTAILTEVKMRSVWDLLHEVFTVQTIMTPWEEVATRPDGASRKEVHAFAEREGYDLIPIVREGNVISLYRWKESAEEQLTDKWLVPDGTPIPELLEHFESKGATGLIVSNLKGNAVGIVTPADLNKMPARVFFFNALAELEVALAEGIRQHYNGKHEQLINFVTDAERKKKLAETLETMDQEDVKIDLVQFLMLSELVRTVRETASLRTKLGFSSKTQVDNQLNGLVYFRNDVAHSVRLMLKNRDEVGTLGRHVKQTRHALDQITAVLKADPSLPDLRPTD